MEIDPRFPAKLSSVAEIPEPLHQTVAESLPSGKPIRLLVHAPSFAAEDEKARATLLAVTDGGWLLASETEAGNGTLEKGDFSETLFLELKSVLLAGQLTIFFAASNSTRSVEIKFDIVGDEFYREAVDVILAGIDPVLTSEGETDQAETGLSETWSLKLRNEIKRYLPRGQRLLAGIRASIISARTHPSPVGALLITERELIVISEEQTSSMQAEEEAQPAEEVEEDLSEIITFIPRVRVADFRVSQREDFGVLSLQIRATNGGQELEIIFPPEEEQAVVQAMEQIVRSRHDAERGDNTR
jgi:hypothetical protein